MQITSTHGVAGIRDETALGGTGAVDVWMPLKKINEKWYYIVSDGGFAPSCDDTGNSCDGTPARWCWELYQQGGIGSGMRFWIEGRPGIASSDDDSHPAQVEFPAAQYTGSNWSTTNDVIVGSDEDSRAVISIWCRWS